MNVLPSLDVCEFHSLWCSDGVGTWAIRHRACESEVSYFHLVVIGGAQQQQILQTSAQGKASVEASSPEVCHHFER